MDRYRRAHFMASTLPSLLWILPMRTPEPPYVCCSCLPPRRTSPLHCEWLSEQLSCHFWTDETCRRLDWISKRTFWALTINARFQIRIRVNMDFVFVYVQCMYTPFSYILYITRPKRNVVFWVWHSHTGVCQVHGPYIESNTGFDKGFCINLR